MLCDRTVATLNTLPSSTEGQAGRGVGFTIEAAVDSLFPPLFGGGGLCKWWNRTVTCLECCAVLWNILLLVRRRDCFSFEMSTIRNVNR